MVSINIFGSSLNDVVKDLDLNNNAIRNLKTPEDENDAANKRYVDEKLLGSNNGENTGILAPNSNKDYGIYFGNNRNKITWRDMVTQPIRFIASSGFEFSLGRTVLMSMSLNNGIRSHTNIDMGSGSRIVNSQLPINDSDCVTKAYCDSKVLKNGDTMLGNLYFDGLTRNIHLGCINLGANNYFRLYLGSMANKINCFNEGFDLFVGRIITVNVGPEMNVIVVDSGGITVSKSLFMNDNSIIGLRTPQEPRDAVNKHYVDTKFDELNARLERLERHFK
jgi:hypothetical protein